MNDLSRVWRYLHARLSADVPLVAIVGNRIHRGAVPQGGTFPAVIYALIAPGDAVTALGGTRVWSAPVFKIVGVAQTTNGLNLEALADRIDVALHNSSGPTASGGYVFSCQYLRPFELIEQSGTTTFQQLGGEYGLTARAI